MNSMHIYYQLNYVPRSIVIKINADFIGYFITVVYRPTAVYLNCYSTHIQSLQSTVSVSVSALDGEDLSHNPRHYGIHAVSFTGGGKGYHGVVSHFECMHISLHVTRCLYQLAFNNRASASRNFAPITFRAYRWIPLHSHDLPILDTS